MPPNLSWGDSKPYAVIQRTLDKDCRQAEEPNDEASRFHLGRQHSAVICSGALLLLLVLRPSLVMLFSHKSGRCAVELYHAPHLWYPLFYTSPMASSALQPPALRRKAATDMLVEKFVKHDSWPIQPDILNPPLQRLTSRKPLWLDLQPVDIKSRWRHNWKSAQVVNSHLMCHPTIWQLGFDLPRQQWSLLNRFRTEQGHCSVCRRKWRLTDTDLRFVSVSRHFLVARPR